MELKQSGFGISSFVLAIINILLLFVVVIILTYIDLSYPGGVDALPEDAPHLVLPALIAILTIVIALVSVGLSIGGLCQKDRKKAFSVAGLIIQLIFLFLMLLVILFA